jgi:hypothetical protein
MVTIENLKKFNSPVFPFTAIVGQEELDVTNEDIDITTVR